MITQAAALDDDQVQIQRMASLEETINRENVFNQSAARSVTETAPRAEVTVVVFLFF